MKYFKLPSADGDYTVCNCDQSSIYLSIINEMVKYFYNSEGPVTRHDKELFEMAEQLIIEFQKE